MTRAARFSPSLADVGHNHTGTHILAGAGPSPAREDSVWLLSLGVPSREEAGAPDSGELDMKRPLIYADPTLDPTPSVRPPDHLSAPQARTAKLMVALALAVTLGGLPRLMSGIARADEPTHEIQKTTPHATVGVPATASVTVQGKNGWHVNEEAPITMNLKADPGVDLPKSKLGRPDLASASKQSARFDISFSASGAGKKTITAETRFVMCQEQACKPVKETVALEIDVASATPPAAATGKSTRAKKNPSAHATP
jgi:hypothetical protein